MGLAGWLEQWGEATAVRRSSADCMPHLSQEQWHSREGLTYLLADLLKQPPLDTCAHTDPHPHPTIPHPPQLDHHLQGAAQEGKFLAHLFSRNNVAPYPGPAPAASGPHITLEGGVWVPLPEGAPTFE